MSSVANQRNASLTYCEPGGEDVTPHHLRVFGSVPAAISPNRANSAIGSLLDEITWEGNARVYRGGGSGRENVLTTEVFWGRGLLPRRQFLAGPAHRCRRRLGPRVGGRASGKTINRSPDRRPRTTMGVW